MDDDSLYNAIIAALAIGIVIVIATLIFARPPPERFTELYINDHRSLPKYVTSGEQIPFSFSIVNHERNLTSYRYNITTELFAFNRACEQPRQYFEPIEDSTDGGIRQPGLPPTTYRPSGTNRSELPPDSPPLSPSIPSRRATSSDPALLIKEPNFTAQIGFRTLNGVGEYALFFDTIEGKRLLAISLSESEGSASIESPQSRKKTNLSLEKGTQHQIRIERSGQQARLAIDGKPAGTVPMEFGPGFLALETRQTYADVSGLTITQAGQQQRASFPHADAQAHEDYLLEEGPEFIGQQLNFSRLSLETSIRLKNESEVSLGITGAFTLTYRKDRLILNGIEGPLPPSRRNVHTIKVELDKSAKAWIDGEFILEAPAHAAQGRPFLRRAELDVRSFAIRSLDEPVSVRYTIPALEVNLPSRPLPLRGFLLTGGEENVTELVSDLYAEERLDWRNYYVTGSYADQFDNGTITFTLYGQNETIYSLTANHRIEVAHIASWSNGTFVNTSVILEPAPSQEKEFNIDVQGNLATFIVDNIIVLERELDRASGGVILLNASPEIRFEALYVQDKDNPVIRIFEPPAESCDPIPIASNSELGSLTLAHNESVSINASASLEGLFDIARVRVALDSGHDVHFWVTRT